MRVGKETLSGIFRSGKKGFFLAALLLVSTSFFAQDSTQIRKEAQRYLGEAQSALADNNFPQAEASYRKAIAKDPTNALAKYNLGNTYFQKQKFEEAEQRYKQALEVANTKAVKHKIHHNLGNVYMQNENYAEAVRAYENALRNDPTDEETRYNLAYAKKMLEKEQNKQGDKDDEQEGQDQQNQDGDGGEDQQDQQNQQNQQNQQGEDERQNQNQPQQQEGDQKSNAEPEGEGNQSNEAPPAGEGDQQKPQEPRQNKLSPEQVKNLLERMENEEKKVQEKLNARKAQGQPKRTEKDW